MGSWTSRWGRTTVFEVIWGRATGRFSRSYITDRFVPALRRHRRLRRRRHAGSRRRQRLPFPHSSSEVWVGKTVEEGDGRLRRRQALGRDRGSSSAGARTRSSAPTSGPSGAHLRCRRSRPYSERPPTVFRWQRMGRLLAVLAIAARSRRHLLASGDFMATADNDPATGPASYGSNSIQIPMADSQGSYSRRRRPALPEALFTLGSGRLPAGTDTWTWSPPVNFHGGSSSGNGDGTFHRDGVPGRRVRPADHDHRRFRRGRPARLRPHPVRREGGVRSMSFGATATAPSGRRSRASSPRPNSSAAGDFNGDGASTSPSPTAVRGTTPRSFRGWETAASARPRAIDGRQPDVGHGGVVRFRLGQPGPRRPRRRRIKHLVSLGNGDGSPWTSS